MEDNMEREDNVERKDNMEREDNMEMEGNMEMEASGVTSSDAEQDGKVNVFLIMRNKSFHTQK